MDIRDVARRAKVSTATVSRKVNQVASVIRMAEFNVSMRIAETCLRRVPQGSEERNGGARRHRVRSQNAFGSQKFDDLSPE